MQPGWRQAAGPQARRDSEASQDTTDWTAEDQLPAESSRTRGRKWITWLNHRGKTASGPHQFRTPCSRIRRNRRKRRRAEGTAEGEIPGIGKPRGKAENPNISRVAKILLSVVRRFRWVGAARFPREPRDNQIRSCSGSNHDERPHPLALLSLSPKAGGVQQLHAEWSRETNPSERGRDVHRNGRSRDMAKLKMNSEVAEAPEEEDRNWPWPHSWRKLQ